MLDHKSESDVLRSIKNNLPLYCREVIWIDRLQSGTVRHGANWIHLCKPGTPDLFAIVKDHDDAHTLFIECKSKTGRQSLDQKAFQYRIAGFAHIHYVLARNLNEVITYIKKNITGDTQ